MKRCNLSWDALLVMSVVSVAGICSQTQQTALAEDEALREGRVVQIATDAEDAQAIEKEVLEEPTYWIGIRGRGVQSPVLRTQLQLAEDMGVVVEGVIKESPANKAGLRKYDIILRANGDAVHGMEVLQQQVRENGEKPIELKVIRLGKEETIVVVPEELPQDLATPNANPGHELRDRLGDARPDALRQLMERLQREPGARRLGPRLFLDNAQPDQLAVPNGVSISVTRKNGETVKITIHRGEETWEIVGNNPEALEQLPEDLRPLAEQALQGQAGLSGGIPFDFNKGLEELLPRGLGGLGRGVIQGQELSSQEKELSERLEKIEQELRKLRERMLNEIPAN